MAGIYGAVKKLCGALSSEGLDKVIVEQGDNGLVSVQTLTNATSEGAGSELSVSGRSKHVLVVVASGVSAGAVLKLQGTVDDTNWFDIEEEIVDRDGVTVIEGERIVTKVRGAVEKYADGTYNAIVMSVV